MCSCTNYFLVSTLCVSCQMPNMFVLNPLHLVSLHVFLHCRAHSLCARLTCPVQAFPRPWPPTSQTVVIAILPAGYSHLQTHSSSSFPSFSSLRFSAWLWHIIISLELLPAHCSHQPQLPPSPSPPATAPTKRSFPQAARPPWVFLA